MSYLPAVNGVISSVNSSTSVLSSSATFTGTAEDVSKYPSVTVAVLTDQAGTLYMEFSPDGTNWDSSLSFAVAASNNDVHRLTVTRKYFRAKFTNTSASAQTSFRLQTTFGHQTALTSALNSVVQQDADTLMTRNYDFYVDVKFGKIQNHSMDTKFGRNSDIDAAEDIWNGGGTYTGFPTTGSAETVTVTSAAGASDAGMDVVLVGLDEDYNEQTETVRLNGSGTATSVNTWWRLARAYCDPGTSSNTVNAGEITCTMSTTTSVVFFVMPAGGNQTHVCALTVPAGYSMLIKRIYIAGARVNGSIVADFALRTRALGKLFRDRRLFTAGNNVAANITYIGGLLVPEKTDVKISCTSVSTTNGDFTAEFAYLLIKD